MTPRIAPAAASLKEQNSRLNTYFSFTESVVQSPHGTVHPNRPFFGIRLNSEEYIYALLFETTTNTRDRTHLQLLRRPQQLLHLVLQLLVDGPQLLLRAATSRTLRN